MSVLSYEMYTRIQIGMFRPIRLDHTNCLQVVIKTHQLEPGEIPSHTLFWEPLVFRINPHEDKENIHLRSTSITRTLFRFFSFNGTSVSPSKSRDTGVAQKKELVSPIQRSTMLSCTIGATAPIGVVLYHRIIPRSGASSNALNRVSILTILGCRPPPPFDFFFLTNLLGKCYILVQKKGLFTHGS